MQLLTERESCERLNISRPTFRRLIERGQLPEPVRFGRAIRFDSDELESAVRRLRENPDA